MPESSASYTVTYNNRNITTDVAPYLISLTYTDKTEKEADELEITLEDTDQRWQNEWYPDKNASIAATIIQGGKVLNCGVFKLDDITLAGSKDAGDTVTLKCLATGFHKALRTKKTRGHESKTLREIANTIATENGLTVQGSVPAISIERVTQNREHDVGFLQRLGHEYGLVFSIKNDTLVFTSIFDLEKRDAVLTFDKSDLGGYNITDKSFGTYSRAQSQFHNPNTKKLIKSSYSSQSDAANGLPDDTLVIRSKAENQQQADLKTKVALYRANGKQQGGNISYPGNVLAVAGNNIILQHLGQLSGKYHLTQSTHTVTKDGGYTGSGEVKRLALIAAEKRKANIYKPTPVQSSLTTQPKSTVANGGNIDTGLLDNVFR